MIPYVVKRCVIKTDENFDGRNLKYDTSYNIDAID